MSRGEGNPKARAVRVTALADDVRAAPLRALLTPGLRS